MTLTNLMPANDVYIRLHFLPERNIYGDQIFGSDFWPRI